MTDSKKETSDKKIGVLNFQYSNHNYGAVLQAAALQYFLRDLGFDTTHINYKPRKKISARRYLGEILRYLKLKKARPVARLRNTEAFERFRNVYLRRTDEIMTSEAFKEVSSEFDAVIVGSDQVWRPSMAGDDPIIFFLGSVPKGVDRIAYAASFGDSVWESESDPNFTSQIGKELKQFKAISCREDSGVEICKNTFGLTATHVLDPVMLVDQSFFGEMAKDSPVHPYELVYYKLDEDEDFKLFLSHIERKGQTSPKNLFLKEGTESELSEVSEWVGNIIASSTVITDSFHCLCLSLLFNKEVFYCPNKKRGQSRIESLFRELNIDVSTYYEKDGFVVHRIEYSKISVDFLLESKRSTSRLFILDALN
jgi:hypothetical protein